MTKQIDELMVLAYELRHAHDNDKEFFADTLKRALEAALKPGEPVADKFSAMHANGDVWITTIAAAKIAMGSAPPAQTPDALKPGEPVTWAEAEAIAIRPSVEDAIEVMLADQTLDNATGVVMAVLNAAPPAQPDALPSTITEEMHEAACKVLLRANGLDGTPQRMLDAMRAAAPPVQAPDALKPVERPCHVYSVTKTGARTEWEPTTMALALPDGKYALYTLYTTAPPAQTPVEQARLLGIGGEKELALMAKLEAAEKEIQLVRNAALEEAAMVCESEYPYWDNERPLHLCATTIRSRKS